MTTEKAILDSIVQNSIVTIVVDTRDDERVSELEALSDGDTGWQDRVREFWGTDEDGDTWSVHVQTHELAD